MDTVNNGEVYWVVDVDIKGYFCNISHVKSRIPDLVHTFTGSPVCFSPCPCIYGGSLYSVILPDS